MRLFLDLLASKKCINCPEINQDINNLCFSCWDKISFISNSKPQKQIAVTNYNETSKNLVINLKYRDNHLYANVIAKFINNYLYYHKINYDYIIPIPLSRKKLFIRNFNQAILIANNLVKKNHKKLLYNGLVKISDTPSQTSLDHEQRQKNLKNKFIITKKHYHLIKDKIILLLDDVSTTNSTFNEAIKILWQAQPKNIISLSFAKNF